MSSIVIQQVIELRRTIDVLLAQPGINPERLAYVGHDFGGMFGSVLAGVDERIQTYVIMTAIPDFSDWFLLETALPADEREAYRRVMLTVAPVNYIGHTQASVFFQFAELDGYVPEVAANTLAEAVTGPKQVTWYQGSERYSLQKNEQATKDRLEWLLSWLVDGSLVEPPASAPAVFPPALALVRTSYLLPGW